METTNIEGLHTICNFTALDVKHNLVTTPVRIVVTLFTALMILLNFLLNPLMLFTLRRVTSIKPTTKIFMASLTLSDLGNGLIHLFGLVELFAGSWLLGDFLCAARSVLAFTFAGLSCTSLLLLTVDRYIAISRPLHYPSLMTEFRSKLTVCSTWAVTFLKFTLMYGFSGTAAVSPYDPKLCTAKTDDWRICLVAALLIISLATIFILYAHIILIARNQTRRIAAENQAGNGRGGQRKNTRAATTIIIITGTLIITWIPTVIGMVIVSQSEWCYFDRHLAFSFTESLLLANGWLNVVIYYLRNRDLRQVIRGQLSDWCQKLNQRF